MPNLVVAYILFYFITVWGCIWNHKPQGFCRTHLLWFRGIWFELCTWILLQIFIWDGLYNFAKIDISVWTLKMLDGLTHFLLYHDNIQLFAENSLLLKIHKCVRFWKTFDIFNLGVPWCNTMLWIPYYIVILLYCYTVICA